MCSADLWPVPVSGSQGTPESQWTAYLSFRGIYRSGPADWIGQGKQDPDRWRDGQRPALHPGWMILGLSAVGWWRRGLLAASTCGWCSPPRGRA